MIMNCKLSCVFRLASVLEELHSKKSDSGRQPAGNKIHAETQTVEDNGVGLGSEMEIDDKQAGDDTYPSIKENRISEQTAGVYELTNVYACITYNYNMLSLSTCVTCQPTPDICTSSQ